MKISSVVSILILGVCGQESGRTQKCPSITSGRYSLRYTFNSNERQSLLEISAENYRKYQNDKIVDSGQIEKLFDCFYLFKSKIYTALDTTGLPGLINRSFGPPCIEISRVNADTIFFRTTPSGNLHITINEGQLIKHRQGP
jgi:hypothetical protein